MTTCRITSRAAKIRVFLPFPDHSHLYDDLRWESLDIDLGVKCLEHPDRFPIFQRWIQRLCDKDVVSSRLKAGADQQKHYEVTVSYTFTGTFTIQVDSEEHAKHIAERQCRPSFQGIEFDVSTPFNEIAWDFTAQPSERIDKVAEREF